MKENRFKYLLSWVLWPTLLGLCIAVTAYGFSQGHPILFFNMAYAFLIFSLWRLEIFMPHAKEWQKPDGQNFANIAHTLTSKGTVQALLLLGFAGFIDHKGLIETTVGDGVEMWPHHWPFVAQVALGLIVSEFGSYWGHRLAHEVPVLWRFHAIHHSATRLWFLNTGRFHFVDAFKSVLMSMCIFLLIGVPMPVIQWVGVLTAFIGMLTHCNVEMRFGWIGWIFNTPVLHRWHHSQDLQEGNKNYGENVMLWDILFGTYFSENRPTPVDIGVKEYIPEKFALQILWPFLTDKMRQRIAREYAPSSLKRKCWRSFFGKECPDCH